jgi:iron complex transport system substrate-binding protein
MRRVHLRLKALACVAFVMAAPALAAPQRVVSTFLCTDEYVFRLLPSQRIAALSYEATDRHPVVSTIADSAMGIPVIRPSTETVLKLKPDLVVMYNGTNPRLHANLKDLGIPIAEVPWANSLADVRRVTTMLGDRLGSPERARVLLAEMDRKIAEARSRAPNPPVGAILYEPQGYATVQGVTDEVMRISGIMNVAPPRAMTRSGTLPVEAVIEAAPELLILGGEARSGSGRAYALLHHPALKALEGRTTMEFANLTPLLCPGPWSVESAHVLGDLARKSRALAPGKAPN